MSYTKTTWHKGDVITAERLNKMEDGIESAAESSSGGATLVVTYSEEGTTGSIDKTWNEIKDAFPNVIIKNIVREGDWVQYICESVRKDQGVYSVTWNLGDMILSAQSADDYPTISYD